MTDDDLLERIRLAVEADCFSGSMATLAPALAAEVRRLREENERLRAKVTTRAREQLKQLLSDLSEEHWCAGWLTDWEFMTWSILLRFEAAPHDGEHTGNFKMEPWAIKRLRELADDAGGWIVWSDAAEGETFIPMDEWLKRYAAYPFAWTGSAVDGKPEGREDVGSGYEH